MIKFAENLNKLSPASVKSVACVAGGIRERASGGAAILGSLRNHDGNGNGNVTDRKNK